MEINHIYATSNISKKVVGEQILAPHRINVKEDTFVGHSKELDEETKTKNSSLNKVVTLPNGLNEQHPAMKLKQNNNLGKSKVLSRSLELKEYSSQLSDDSKPSANRSSAKNMSFVMDAKSIGINPKNEGKKEQKPFGHSVLKHIGKIVVCVMSFVSITLIPYHDVVKFNEYWYESIFHWILGALPCYIGVVLTRFKMMFEDYGKSVIPTSSILQIYFSAIATFILSFVLRHLIWSEYLKYNSPTPFQLFIDGYFSILAFWIVLWYKLPEDLRTEIPLRSRLISYCWFALWSSSLPLQVLVLLKMFSMLNEELQWITAIMITIQKVTNNYVMEKFTCNAVKSENNLNAIGITTIYGATVYKIVVVILIGSKANIVTGYCILAIQFLMNMYLCVKIIRLHRQSVEDISQTENLLKRKDECLVKLMLNEIVESLTPIMFIIAFMFAYFGPNAKIIGNIQNGYWQFKAVNDIHAYLIGILYTATVDLSSVVISLHLLWGFCRIDGLKFVIKNIGRFGTVMLFNIFSCMNFVSMIP